MDSRRSYADWRATSEWRILRCAQDDEYLVDRNELPFSKRVCHPEGGPTVRSATPWPHVENVTSLERYECVGSGRLSNCRGASRALSDSPAPVQFGRPAVCPAPRPTGRTNRYSRSSPA